jgi:hypothetical protein
MEQTETSEHSPHPIILIAVAKRIFCIIDKVYKFGRWQFLGPLRSGAHGGLAHSHWVRETRLSSRRGFRLVR